MASSEQTVKERIRAAVLARESGDVSAARSSLEALRPVAEASSAFDWLFFAHSFADVQDDLTQELHWDVIALDALGRLTEGEALAEGVPGGKSGLLPSLHLNLADVYRRLGDEIQALRHFQEGAKYLDALDEESYGLSIREAFREFAQDPASVATTRSSSSSD
jgi:hypothetical protein